MNRQTVLVTGASGFVGGHTALGLARHGINVFSTGGLHECPLEVRCASERVVSCDLTAPGGIETLLRESRPDVIVHAAALASPAACGQEPERAVSTNVKMVKELLFHAERMEKPPMIFQLSTDTVFDGLEAPCGGFTEEDTPSSVAVYSRTKREAELLALGTGLDSIVLRICLAYGSALGERQGFLSWILNALNASKPVTLFEDEFRTPLFVEDLPEAILAILDSKCLPSILSDKRPDARIFHVAGPERISRFEFGRRLVRFTGHSAKLLHRASISEQQTGSFRSPDTSLSGNKLRTLIGFETTSLDDGLRKVFGESGPVERLPNAD